MIYLAAFLAIAFFAVGLGLFGIVPVASSAVATSRKAVQTLQNPKLGDIEKERAVRQASVSLLASFASILGRGVAAAVLSLLPLVAFDLTGLAEMTDVTDWLATWEAILLASGIMTVVYVVGKRR